MGEVRRPGLGGQREWVHRGGWSLVGWTSCSLLLLAVLALGRGTHLRSSTAFADRAHSVLMRDSQVPARSRVRAGGLEFWEVQSGCVSNHFQILWYTGGRRGPSAKGKRGTPERGALPEALNVVSSPA